MTFTATCYQCAPTQKADWSCQCPFLYNQIFAHRKKGKFVSSHNCLSGVERNNLNKGNK